MSAEINHGAQLVKSSSMSLIDRKVVEVCTDKNIKERKNSGKNNYKYVLSKATCCIPDTKDKNGKNVNIDYHSNDAPPKTSHTPNLNINMNEGLHRDDSCDRNNSIDGFPTKGVSLMSFNIATLPGKFDEFRHFVQSTQTDIIALNETRLDSSIPDYSKDIEGYALLRNDRKRDGGGVAMYLKRSSGFTFKIRKDLMPNELEIIVVEVKISKAKPMIVVSWYRPPDSEMKIFEHLESILDQIDCENKDLILMGDVNCDLLTETPHCYTIKMNEIARNYHLVQLIKEATRVTETSRTLIDHIYTSRADNISKSGVLKTGVSDHYMVYAVLGKENKKTQYRHRYSVNRRYKNFNVEMFKTDLRNKDWSNIERHLNVDDAVTEFESEILEAANRHAPLRRKRVRHKNPSPWLTDDIFNAMRKRDQLQKQASEFSSPQLWAEYRYLRNKVNTMIKQSKKTYLTDAVKTKNSKTVWSNIRHIVPSKNKNVDINCIKTDTSEHSNPVEIANVMNEYFAKVGPSIADKIPVVDAGVNIPNTDNQKNVFNFQYVDNEYVLKELLSLPDNKATGVDDIPSKLLKLCAEEIVSPLTYIINLSLSTGIFPNNWKKARICPVFKGGEDTEPCNYRPISILPVLSKIMERVVFNQLYPFLDSQSLLHDNQSGFRPKFSTSSALLNITEDWIHAIDKGEFVGIVMLDLQKAFDTVNHSILIHKLQEYGLNINVINWFQSYLKDRNHVTTINGMKSNVQNSTCGIPQGSILGPLLFIMYINDLPKHVSNVQISMYADDTAIFYTSKDVNDIVDKINDDMKNVDNWLSRNKLSLNIQKTNFMIIGTPQKLASITNQQLDIKIRGISIQRVSSCKHLGIIIDESLLWGNHVEHVTKKVLTGLYFLKRSNNILPKNIQSMLYKTIIAPHFDYCNVVWGRCNKFLCNKLQVLQNRAAKIITGTRRYDSSSQALSDLNWKNLDEKLYYNEAVTMFKIVNRDAPHYLNNRFVRKETRYNMRNSGDLHLVKPNTEYKKRSLSYRGAKLWNSLDANVKSVSNLKDFKQFF